MERFSQFLHIREQIASYLSTITEHIQRLGGIARVSHLNNIEQELLHNNFRVLVCGEFKRGKSCLINSLLGASVVPMKIAPCTGTITEVKYGQMPFLTIYPIESQDKIWEKHISHTFWCEWFLHPLITTFCPSIYRLSGSIPILPNSHC